MYTHVCSYIWRHRLDKEVDPDVDADANVSVTEM